MFWAISPSPFRRFKTTRGEMKFKKSISSLCIAVGLVAGAFQPANASTTTSSQEFQNKLNSIVLSDYPVLSTSPANAERVFALLNSSSDLALTLDSLSPRDIADFEYGYIKGDTTVTFDTAPVMQSRAVTTTCSTGVATASHTNTWGGLLYSWKISSQWCVNSSGVITKSVMYGPYMTFTEAGYQPAGTLDLGSIIYSNQSRSWGQVKIDFVVLGVWVYSDTPCLRLVGAADGHSWFSSACGPF